MKSRSMVLESFNKPLVMKELPIPPLTEGQVLVRLKASGVCGSDIHMWRGEDPRTPLPIILGHEGVGDVADIAGTVKTVQGEEVKTGDRIFWNRGVLCGSCFYCKVAGQPALCENRRVYGINCSCSDHPYLSGCYSEYLVLLPGTDIFRIESDIDPAVLVSAACAGATMAHAFALAPPQPGDTVVVQGPGPLGLYAVAFARFYGASQIIVIGGSANRLQLCGEFGATTLLNRRETSTEERRADILKRTYGRGADLVVETVGYPVAFDEGLEIVRRGGTYLTTGFAQPVGQVTVDPYRQIVNRNIKVQGVWVSDTSHAYQAMQLVSNNPQLFKKSVTHRFSLEKANEALEVMANKEALKAVLEP